jgi:hypothetical protein
MNDDKLALYESLIRASLALIFLIALSVGAFGLVAISQMLMREAVANRAFPENEAFAVETAR